ncbi:hypothetical protein PR048_019803 [Dryococelus australis]|uniref:DDE-1 domain-containing protein n=1 Tax=Dryococelus australis TaxID=614101 RepID=A0ABQ9H4H6_9NEOP|nr:hypothetical protein PR048_019803 [Dryococelus australis]
MASREVTATEEQQVKLNRAEWTEEQLKWLRLFLKRHPDIANRQTQSMNHGLASKMNQFIVSYHFQKFREILLENGLMERPEMIYNICEKGVRLTIHDEQNVLARRGAQMIHFVSSKHAENRLKLEWYSDIPVGTVICMCSNGSMTTALFIRWLEHFARYEMDGKALLIFFFWASCHLDSNIVRAADQCGIICYCLPSNTTLEFQPLDKPVSKMFESCCDDELLLAYDRKKKDFRLTRITLSPFLSEVWARSVTAPNIVTGFRVTGIYPLDLLKIPDKAFDPSAVTEMPQVSESTETDADDYSDEQFNMSFTKNFHHRNSRLQPRKANVKGTRKLKDTAPRIRKKIKLESNSKVRKNRESLDEFGNPSTSVMNATNDKTYIVQERMIKMKQSIPCELDFAAKKLSCRE